MNSQKKMRVLDLQTLEMVAGGSDEAADKLMTPSTRSVICGGVDTNEKSGWSIACRPKKEIEV
ncbi:hypothetical protein [Parachitinimonas caeni]|uniref:Lantibiotic n=1 Tax=Parachitinimonas caeni TaxID=3031301 RepID=A0ABT7DXB8_9NEIS|nr:hypothetical protein [Parachitinimonas caeni]MDK2123728.1 hypothetical protein [Parachitinimonas caeni]